jgi:hypothetical protein
MRSLIIFTTRQTQLEWSSGGGWAMAGHVTLFGKREMNTKIWSLHYKGRLDCFNAPFQYSAEWLWEHMRNDDCGNRPPYRDSIAGLSEWEAEALTTLPHQHQAMESILIRCCISYVAHCHLYGWSKWLLIAVMHLCQWCPLYEWITLLFLID